MKGTTLILNQDEKADLYISLSMRCGYIETGTINRAKDLKSEKDRHLIKPLSIDQMKAIIRMEGIMEKLM